VIAAAAILAVAVLALAALRAVAAPLATACAIGLVLHWWGLL
jgi:hypothetical protein